MLLFILYKICQIVVLILPIKFSYWLASRIADIYYYTSKKDRKLLINNLVNVFGKNDKKTRHTTKVIMRNFGKYLVEFLRFIKMDMTYIKKYVKLEGLENLKKAIDANKGTVVFSAHLGNWEWGAAIVARLGYPMNVIALSHKNKNVNRFFINQRALAGVKNIPLGGSVRKSLEVLSKNEIIGILSDRDFSNNSIEVNFFGKPAFVPIGTALFAVKSRCSILPAFIIRQKDDTHKLIFEKLLEYKISGDTQRDIRDIMQKVAEIIEKYVRLYPEQWFIFSNPWEPKSDKIDSIKKR